MQDRKIDALYRDALAGRLTRRDVLRRAATLGLSLPVVAALLAACGGSNNSSTTTSSGTTSTTTATGGGAASSPAAGGATATRAASPVTSASASPVASPSTGTTTASPSATTAVKYTLDNPPAVANAAAAKKFTGAKLTYYGDQVGIGADIDKALANRFKQDTGIEINVVPRPKDSTESLAQFQRTFQAKSGDIDVLMVDVVWPGILAQHLVDLKPAFGNDVSRFYETIIANNTINGKLVGIPWFGDFGMLYYRTDLLQKYGFSSPPTTWDDLEQQAKKIQDGEKGSNANFQGFVFQGNAYEGLTCDGLEWIASSGGGTIIDESGKVTLNNPQAIAILNKVKGWVGNITPRGVTSYQEEDARTAFQGGNSAFMRNWPYAYALASGSDSAVKGKFDVAPLPAASGQKHVGTVGGWQIAVSTYSKNKDAAVEFARYLTSADVQAYRAVVGSFVPTMPEVASRPEVAQVMPFLTKLNDVVRVTRPSSAAGEKYNQVSTAFFQGVNQILNGQDASQIIPGTAQQIQRAMG